jgi:glycosyl transferase family 17
MLWDAFMFRDEDHMLQLRLDSFRGYDVRHVLVEAPYTHRGVPKPLHFAAALQGTPDRNQEYLEDLRVRHVVDRWDPDVHPWTNEHHQRNQAWAVIDSEAADDDWVLICDLDEIPAPELLGWLTARPAPPLWVFSVWMRTFLFAVDWEVDYQVLAWRGAALPPTCVIASAGYLRQQARHGEYLAEVRDGRLHYDQIELPSGLPGGWHFSWCGGPQAQAEKLATATCHTEILNTPEGELIRTGARYRAAADGGGLPVRPVDVDGTWPAPIARREVPACWFRPRNA